jgi:hypothetical protein
VKAATPAASSMTDDKKAAKGKCYKCKGKGHLASACPNEGTAAPVAAPSSSIKSSNGSASTSVDAKKAGKCYKCKQKGHMANDCPNGN